jgi:hypothetical protein
VPLLTLSLSYLNQAAITDTILTDVIRSVIWLDVMRCLTNVLASSND